MHKEPTITGLILKNPKNMYPFQNCEKTSFSFNNEIFNKNPHINILELQNRLIIHKS